MRANISHTHGKKTTHLGAAKRLRAFYKSHPGVVRFINFPLTHRLWLEDNRISRWPIYEERMEPIHSSLAFDATVWDLDAEELPHPLREPYRVGKKSWWRPKMNFLNQHFVAPFKKSNEALILYPDISLKIVNSSEAMVLLDWCQEQGAQLSKDFEFTKVEKYIVPKSDEMRLMLVEKLGEWPEFDMMFTVTHPAYLRYTVTIDDLKEK